MSESLFTSQTPTVNNASDGAPGIVTATTIKFAVAGSISDVRFFASNSGAMTGTWTVAVWEVLTSDATSSGTGNLLGSKTFAGSSVTGNTWNTVTLDSPISVTTGKLYRVGLHTPQWYVATLSFFGSDLVNGNLTAPHNGDDPVGLGSNSQGTFDISATLIYPKQPGNASCYFVDVVFTASGGGSTVNADSARATTATLASTAAVTRPADSARAVTATLAATAGVTPGADAARATTVGLTATASVVRNANAVLNVGVTLAAAADPPAPAPARQGNWNSLLGMMRANEAQLETELTRRPTQCPNHLYPLDTDITGNYLHCVFGGEVFDLNGAPVYYQR